MKPRSLPLGFSRAEIERRRALWWALSDLMLDTDMPEVWGPNIARTMRQGHWTLEATRQIFLQDVGPAFMFNFVVVAGEWAGWEESFVTRRVLIRLRRPRWLRWLNARPFQGQLQAVWEHTLPYVKRALNETAAEGSDAEAWSR